MGVEDLTMNKLGKLNGVLGQTAGNFNARQRLELARRLISLAVILNSSVGPFPKRIATPLRQRIPRLRFREGPVR